MRSHPLLTEQIKTRQRSEIVDITPALKRFVQQHRITDGLAIVYVPHTTAAVTINENADPDVKSDLLAKLAELVPQRESYYRHAEGNSDSHLKAAMVGHSVTVLVESGDLVLGRWQGVFLAEFDGRAKRKHLLRLVCCPTTPRGRGSPGSGGAARARRAFEGRPGKGRRGGRRPPPPRR